LKVQLLVEAQFDRARKTVIAADLGAAIAAPERDAAEIELLRGEERAGRSLTGGGKFQRPCIRERLIAREPETQRGEFSGCTRAPGRKGLQADDRPCRSRRESDV
jgi:hypothetical protein